MSLESRRAFFNRTLTVPCDIYRDGRDADGLSTGEEVFVASTYCSIYNPGNNSLGASKRIYMDAYTHVQQSNTPGNRVLSFPYDAPVESNDEIRPTGTFAGPRYKLGIVSTDDPMRNGLQAQAEIKRPPKKTGAAR